MSGDAENRTPAARRGTSTRRAVADRVEALTQPVPGHELADVRFERRTVIGPASARVLFATIAALVVVVGGVMLFNDSRSNGDGGDGARGDIVAGLSPGVSSGVSGDAGVELAGDIGGDDGEAGREADGESADESDGVGPVVVSVQGMVHRPGLFTVDGGTRVGELIDRAGGVREEARVEGINLAEPVVDGMQVAVDQDGSRVSYPGEAPQEKPQAEAQGGPQVSGNSEPVESAGLVDVNTADAAELMTLSGVGPATAEAIISWRENNGSFGVVEQLMDVSGIGPAKFEAMRDSVTVG